ncbi:MAG TPA: hypothetical protein VFF49_11730, partial [Thermodesulfobacteriota bacterium]|nr:hypothetical protein [Thermodesulfobacteriota bacterium]
SLDNFFYRYIFNTILSTLVLKVIPHLVFLPLSLVMEIYQEDVTKSISVYSNYTGTKTQR